METLADDNKIRWRVFFFKSPIAEEELRGVSVFANVKLAQRPFFFGLTGGIGGQTGKEYLSGQVKADYLDEAADDLIATERQRINWQHKDAICLQDWGQKRIKLLLRIWKEKRGEARRLQIESKVAGFSTRLEKLPSHERRTVRTALNRLGMIESMSDEQFTQVGSAMLTAWEQGRLHNLIDDIALQSDIDATRFLELLIEADVLTALNIAEVVRTKIETIHALQSLVEKRALEGDLRDYIAERPYLLHPKWETFRKEKRVEGLLIAAAKSAKLDSKVYKGRLDLALSGNGELLVIEFMRPGLTLDLDHAGRIQNYIEILREDVSTNSALEIDRVSGLIVADKLSKAKGMKGRLQNLKMMGILAFDWKTLLLSAEANLRDFLRAIADRAPNDSRIVDITTSVGQSLFSTTY